MMIIDGETALNIRGENIFVDTNILLFVDGALSFDKKERNYSDVYFELKKNNEFYTSEKCLGEFFNKLTNFYYDLDKKENPQIEGFKKYRKSSDFSASMDCIYDATVNFMSDMNVISNYESIDIRRAFEKVKTGLIDYCDVTSARLCVDRNFYFFSDDGDAFYCRDLKIITNNKWILSNSKRRDELSVL
ncbi:hypothetical protein RvVAR0630_21070 [Agrobacterium vitis]|uniref:hypothetical protein n=1 Tax=Agrobacterium vitis TaxID=373 RepID=UPI0015D871B8|nr:hypothetical protein [Agrobacterium vitis]BCH59483.1 hypothetical protein RvVAR0630_21070 [Agrobacterium vitis]